MWRWGERLRRSEDSTRGYFPVRGWSVRGVTIYVKNGQHHVCTNSHQVTIATRERYFVFLCRTHRVWRTKVARSSQDHQRHNNYYAWGKNPPVPPNAGSGIQSFLRVLNFYQVRSEFIQKNPHKNDRFRFKVMNSPIYSIQREVLKEYEYLKSQICLLHCVFIILCCCFFSFYISFFQITAKRTFGLYNQLGFWWTVCFHYVSYLPVMHDKWL